MDKYDSKLTRRVGRPSRKPYELDLNGIVSLPVSSCYQCGRSCRKAPLVACDYCPLLYHQDCLDPPITAMPTGIWMCPNHAEQFIDWKLVSSVSASERLRLWEKCSGPIDQHAIKTDFLRRIRTQNAPFRTRLKYRNRNRTNIPGMIKYHYKYPPYLQPSLRDVYRLENIYKKGFSHESLVFRKADEDQIKKLVEKNLLAKPVDENINSEDYLNFSNQNTDASEFVFKVPNQPEKLKMLKKRTIDETKSSYSLYIDEIKMEGCENVNKSETLEIENMSEDDGNLHETDAKLSAVMTSVCDVTVSKHIYEGPPFKKPKVELINEDVESNKLTKRILDDIMSSAVNVEVDFRDLDDNLIKLLAYQRIQQLFADNNNIQSSLNSTKQQFRPTLPSQLLTADDIARIARNFSSPQKCTKPLGTINSKHKNNEIHSNSNYPNKHIDSHNYATLCNNTVLSDNVISKNNTCKQIRIRAILSPVKDVLDGNKWYKDPVSRNKGVAMRFRSFTIGAGPGNDLQLALHGHCNHISAKHAVIFFDEVSQHYELLNYSEYGSEVNGQLFSCDFSYSPVDSAKNNIAQEQSQFKKTVKKM